MRKTAAPSRLAAPLNRLRLAIGRAWLSVYVWLNRHRAPSTLLAETWSAATRLTWLFAGAERHKNRYGYGWRAILYWRVLESLDRVGAHPLPEVAVEGLDILRAAAARPTIVVTVHAPTDAVLNRLFAEAGIPWVLLAAGKPQRRAALLGLSGPLDVVPRTSDTLLVLRRRLAEGRVVCACVDFVDRTAPRGEVFVSPALFDLAKRTGSAIVYAYTGVREDGVIDVTYALPGIDPSAATAEAWAEDFVAWLRTERHDARAWSIRKWSDAPR